MEIKTRKTKYLQLIEVNNNQGLKVTLSTLGASVFSIYFNDEIMTLTPKNDIDFLKENIYYGKTIGPICGRIKDGLLTIDNKEYHYDVNEGKNTLHGGKNGLSTWIFDYEIKEKEIIFKKDGYKITYTFLEEEASFTISFYFESEKLTPVALTNHTYFCLGDEDISNMYLKMDSSRYIEVNPIDLIPLYTKEVSPSFDFRNGQLVSAIIDHSFLFDKDSTIVLENNRYRLQIKTDFTATQIYTDNFVDTTDVINTTQNQKRALAIEPQDNQLKRSAYTSYKRFITYTFNKINY